MFRMLIYNSGYAMNTLSANDLAVKIRDHTGMAKAEVFNFADWLLRNSKEMQRGLSENQLTKLLNGVERKFESHHDRVFRIAAKHAVGGVEVHFEF